MTIVVIGALRIKIQCKWQNLSEPAEVVNENIASISPWLGFQGLPWSPEALEKMVPFPVISAFLRV